MVTLLIDADLLVYKATAATEFETKWDDDNWVLSANENEGYDLAQGAVESLKSTLGTKEVRLAFTGKGNFRKAVYPEYKAPRANTRKPISYGGVKDRLMAAYPSYQFDGIEADDILGIWATRGEAEVVVVSEDKDLKTVPCTLYRQGELRTYSEAEAHWHHMMQTLTGDTSDGYPGCPGVGPVKAEALLAKAKDGLWPAVVAAYEKAGLTEEDALVQARCARILQSSDWDHEKKEVKLWEPK